VVDDAVSVVLVTAQVRVEGGAIITTGNVADCITTVEALAEHPLEGSVTVTE
jgi:hypothetical protein